MVAARYPRALIALHWLTLVLVVVAYVAMEFRGLFPRGSGARELMKAAHYSAGISVLLLLPIRAWLRWRGPVPPVTPALPPAQRIAAAVAHWALYLFLLAMPLAGWVLLSAEGGAATLWGIPLPAVVAPDKGLAHALEDLHEAGANVGYALIALHAAAALFHHFLRRDDTLRRMLPGGTS